MQETAPTHSFILTAAAAAAAAAVASALLVTVSAAVGLWPSDDEPVLVGKGRGGERERGGLTKSPGLIPKS